VLALDRSGVVLASALEFGFAFVPFAGLLLRRAPVVLGIRVQRLDELLLDPRLVLPIFISNIVGPIAPVPVDLARIELTSSACES
jgi:hypothetical protein